MSILKTRVSWQKPRPIRDTQPADDLTPEEQTNLRRALYQLRRKYGSFRALAIVMGVKPETLWQAAKRKRRRPTAGYAVRAARLAGVSAAEILDGSWPVEGACPMCGASQHR